MAERRMFSKTITDCDAFISLPATTQALYFHLALTADDDGISNEVRHAIFNAHATDKDLKSLIEKRFIFYFEDRGVAVIKHWGVHNKIRGDRRKDSKYSDIKSKLFIKKDGAYTDHPPSDNQMTTKCQPSDNQMTTKCQPSDNQMSPQDRIGEDRLVEDNKNTRRFESERLEKAFNDYLEYRKEINCMLTDRGIELTIEKLKKLSNGNEETAVKIINQTIAKGWKDIYQFKETPSKSANDIQRDMSYQEIKDLETQLLRS